MAKYIGLDITCNAVSIYEPEVGISYSEENCVAVDIVTRENLAVGNSARTLYNNTPGAVEIITDLYSATSMNEELLEMNINQAFYALDLKKPTVVLAIRKDEKPQHAASLVNVILEAGAKEVYLVDTMSACALGSGMIVNDKRYMIACDIETDFTVLGLVKGCVNKASKTLPFSIEKLLEVITKFVKNEKSIQITKDTAELILEYSVSSKPQFEYDGYSFTGKDIITGLPVEINMESKQIKSIIAPYIKYLCDNIKQLYNSMSGDIRSQIEDKGLLLTGNAYITTLLKYYIEHTTGLHVFISENSNYSSLKGIGTIIENLDVFEVLLSEIDDD